MSDVIRYFSVDDMNDLAVAMNEKQKTFMAPKTFATPEMYGAIGDGEEDDSSAIQNCIDNNNCIVFSPNKTYKLLSKITIQNKLNFYINFNNCLLTSSAEQAFEIINCNRLFFENLILNCGGNKGIKFGYSTAEDRNGNTWLSNIQVNNSIEYFRFDGAGGYNYFYNCKCNGTLDNSVGFIIGQNKHQSDTIGANYLYFNACAFEGGSTGSSKCAVRLYHVINVYIQNCDFCNITSGNAIELLCTNASYGINVLNNCLWNNDISIYVLAPSLLFFNVSGNEFRMFNSTQKGIVVDTNTTFIDGGAIVSNNTIYAPSNISSIFELRKMSKLVFRNNLLGSASLKPLYNKCTISVTNDNLDTDLPPSKRVSNSSSSTPFTVNLDYSSCLKQPRFNVLSSRPDAFAWSVDMGNSTGVAVFTITPASSDLTYYFIDSYLG